MPSYGTYSAWIEVDDERLPEYQITQDFQPDGIMHVSCYIPSSSGKTFKIGYDETTKHTASDIRFTVDDTACGGKVIRPVVNPYNPYLYNNNNINNAMKSYKEGIESADGLLPLVFSVCHLTDDAAASRSVAGVGEIKVEFFDCTILRTYDSAAKPELDASQSDTLSQPRQIHERAKKGLVHSIQLSKNALKPAGRVLSYSSIIPGPKRVLFRFLYRPLDLLRADGLAPRLPTPTPSPPPAHQPSSQPSASTSSSSWNAKQKQKVHVKKGHNNGGDALNDVIDLTLDDDDGYSDRKGKGKAKAKAKVKVKVEKMRDGGGEVLVIEDDDDDDEGNEDGGDDEELIRRLRADVAAAQARMEQRKNESLKRKREHSPSGSGSGSSLSASPRRKVKKERRDDAGGGVKAEPIVLL